MSAYSVKTFQINTNKNYVLSASLNYEYGADMICMYQVNKGTLTEIQPLGNFTVSLSGTTLTIDASTCTKPVSYCLAEIG